MTPALGALIVAPFLVAITVGGVLVWSAGYRLRWRRATPINEEVS